MLRCMLIGTRLVIGASRSRKDTKMLCMWRDVYTRRRRELSRLVYLMVGHMMWMVRRQEGRSDGSLGVQVSHPRGREVAQVAQRAQVVGERRHVLPQFVVRRRGSVGNRWDARRRRALGRAPVGVAIGAIEAQKFLDRERRSLRHLERFASTNCGLVLTHMPRHVWATRRVSRRRPTEAGRSLSLDQKTTRTYLPSPKTLEQPEHKTAYHNLFNTRFGVTLGDLATADGSQILQFVVGFVVSLVTGAFASYSVGYFVNSLARVRSGTNRWGIALYVTRVGRALVATVWFDRAGC